MLLPDAVETPTVGNGAQRSATVGDRGQKLRVEVARLEERLAAEQRVTAELRAALEREKERADRLEALALRPWWARLLGR